MQLFGTEMRIIVLLSTARVVRPNPEEPRRQQEREDCARDREKMRLLVWTLRYVHISQSDPEAPDKDVVKER